MLLGVWLESGSKDDGGLTHPCTQTCLPSPRPARLHESCIACICQLRLLESCRSILCMVHGLRQSVNGPSLPCFDLLPVRTPYLSCSSQSAGPYCLLILRLPATFPFPVPAIFVSSTAPDILHLHAYPTPSRLTGLLQTFSTLRFTFSSINVSTEQSPLIACRRRTIGSMKRINGVSDVSLACLVGSGRPCATTQPPQPEWPHTMTGEVSMRLGDRVS